MPERPTPARWRSWAVPITVVIVAASLLLLTYLAQQNNGPQQPGSPAAATKSTPDGKGQSPAPDGIEEAIKKVQRRDPKDLLSVGPVDAPVVLIVFSDYQCTFCARWTHTTLPEMKKRADAGQLRIEWRDVNMYGENSKRASLASYAAARQGRFWDYHDKLFPEGKTRPKPQMTADALIATATEMGLDAKKFKEDMESTEALGEIARNEKLATDLGAAATPAFLMGTKPISGAQPTEVFVQAFEQALAASKH
ncbi:DsbA family protein [Austwickia chelonae]|uniref:DsbA family protein n=1 Tax=Austwickia chelonae TaxID=100225 RepID=UPI0013C3699D|nr:thioredoxin domain-containing protein [Austwickia chelonae]